MRSVKKWEGKRKEIGNTVEGMGCKKRNARQQRYQLLWTLTGALQWTNIAQDSRRRHEARRQRRTERKAVAIRWRVAVRPAGDHVDRRNGLLLRDQRAARFLPRSPPTALRASIWELGGARRPAACEQMQRHQHSLLLSVISLCLVDFDFSSLVYLVSDVYH